MNIFNSLGSNYTFATALRFLCSWGTDASRRELVEYLEHRYGGKGVLTYKGREALVLALSALKEKGAVAITGFTCFAVYEAVRESGHTPHYIDIDGSLNFSAEMLRDALDANPAIKAVVVQNTLGNPCDITTIATLCKERGVVLVEDLAHSIGARYSSGEEAGTVGDFVILSFSQDKVVDAVSGGALIIRNKLFSGVAAPTGIVPLAQRLKDRLYPTLTWKIRFWYAAGLGRPYHALVRSLRILSRPLDGNQGPLRGLTNWYCAGILRQYKNLDATAAHRRAIAEVYAKNLDPKIQFPIAIARSSNLRFPILVEGRDRLIAELRENGVHVSDIWYDAPVAPRTYLHRTDYKGGCPGGEKTATTMVNLPTHTNVSPSDAEAIAALVNEWVATEARSEYTPAIVVDAEEWETFLRQVRPHTFLQSWKWGEHYEMSGSKIFRLGVRKNGALVGAALCIKVAARRGAFLLCPHGPILSETEDGPQLLRLFARECTRIAQAEHCDFVRFCPLAPDSPESRSVYRSLGFRDAPIHMHPELSWMLDVSKDEEDLLRDMRKTTRYLVKKMEKEGVEITQSNNPADIEKFWTVYQATVQRQHFTPFNKEYLRKEFELFAADNQALFFFGAHQGECIAAAIIIFYNGQAFYHHSGSIQKSKDINASYLLQWRVIQEAKKRGCTLYNFWGISPADRPKHPWAGLSLFKKGFGGFAEAYLHAQDKPLTSKYALNYTIETARRVRRGL